ncbi:MAG: hypothetical protein MSA56_05320 [Clostridium sp.]|nr:hypothetical protein [Clostridium sp.]
MKKIRKNVFETNSSSTHALTVGRVLGEDYVPYGNNLKIRWFDEEETLTTLKDKVSYLVSHIASWYVYNAEDYEDLIEQVKENWDFKRIENYVWEKYGKKIVFPEYKGSLEDMVEINHQLVSWGHNLDEVLEDIVNEERDYLAEVLEDGKDIEFGRD